MLAGAVGVRFAGQQPALWKHTRGCDIPTMPLLAGCATARVCPSEPTLRRSNSPQIASGGGRYGSISTVPAM